MSVDNHARLLRAAFDRAVAAVSPAACLPSHLPGPIDGRTYLIAFGKAAAAMAEVVSDHLKPDKALVIYPDGHGPAYRLPPSFELLAASHPVPDARSVRAADRALELAGELGAGDRLIALVSGGGSALLAAPVEGVTLTDKQALTRALLMSGASIADINCLRQCLSRIKGGKLARAAGGAEVLSFVISDVPGDDLRLVASGPTSPSSATLAHARAILDWYGFPVAASIRDALNNPANAPVSALPTAKGTLIAGPGIALRAAADLLAGKGYSPVVLGDAIEGEARELARLDGKIALAHAPEGVGVSILAGGEATVRLPSDPPQGGRNLEYALALALELNGDTRISALACDSDGIDGMTPAAGAIIGPDTLAQMRAAGVDPAAALLSHNAYRALGAVDALIITGPTRTNVNDLRLILIEPSA